MGRDFLISLLENVGEGEVSPSRHKKKGGKNIPSLPLGEEEENAPPVLFRVSRIQHQYYQEK